MGGVTGIVTKPVEGTCSSAVKPTLLLQTLSLGVKGKRREQRDFAWWRQTKCYHECWTQLYPVCPYVFCKYMQIGANLQQIRTLSFRIVTFTSYILTIFACRVSIWRKTETCSLQQSAVHYCEWWWNSTPRLTWIRLDPLSVREMQENPKLQM